MTNDQLQYAENYFFGDKTLFDKSDKFAQEWFKSYYKDKSTGTLREEVTLHHLGYTKNQAKHGHDGYHNVRKKFVEVKPQYAHVCAITNKQNKLSGGGSFNDITMAKIEVMSEWDVVCSGFAEDRVIFILRFPAEYIIPYLTTTLNKIIGIAERRKTISFNWHQYKDCKDLEIIWFDMTNSKKFISKSMYSFLDKKYIPQTTVSFFCKFYD